jgi:hypothetical protein
MQPNNLPIMLVVVIHLLSKRRLQQLVRQGRGGVHGYGVV